MFSKDKEVIFLNYLLAAKLRYYAENNSNNILKKVNSSISRSITTCRPELLCILDDMVSIEPCSYWNKDVFETTEKNLQNIVQKGNSIFINEEIFELFFSWLSCLYADNKCNK